ncbi:ABC transporter permease [Deinococcus yavapaiensis]|uniref:Peptide/nickel transport system permease protein n=1 Tax=Deinococcus yavapaiensis KR-236 TaxID=694435 RepID=A0A318S7J1_9DEIO|nr:ABC transporter permease [Deinococcus yavapaiensis]PYE53866.1 peptide/nickel transport system permease protein [Deinococcus yavapaiensis KR-236]
MTTPPTPLAASARRVRSNATPTALIGTTLFALLVVVSFLGALVVGAPQLDATTISGPPSASHVLGTDYQGRDNLALLVRGGADMVLLALIAGTLTTLVAVTLGSASAYVGGRVDALLMRATDLWLTIPRFILLVVVASTWRVQSTVALAALIAVFSWPVLARQVRANVLSLKEREYIEAARLLDLGPVHMLLRELLPSMAPFIVVSTIQSMTQAIYQQVGLAFLGILPLRDNWGLLFSVAYGQNAIYFADAAWSVLAPIGAICLLQLSLVMMARGYEETFNPRLRSQR